MAIKKGSIKVVKFKCDRCGHEWYHEEEKFEEAPLRCASCKTPYWNIPPKRREQEVHAS